MEGDQQDIQGSSTRNYQLPPGYRFIPTDYEVIIYLQKKIKNEPILIGEMKEVDLYKNDPKTLSETYPALGEVWFFFTQRTRKYPNGSRPDRTVGGGHWKATGADIKVYHEGQLVGFKKTLVFHQGKHQESIKTNWIMHEFRIDQTARTKRDGNDMKLADWVSCRIYEKASRLKGNKREDEGGDLPVDDQQSPSQVEEENTQVVVKNEDLNHENDVGAIEIDSGVDKNGSLAAFVMPELDEELDALISFGDFPPPSVEDFLSFPDPVDYKPRKRRC